MATEFHYEPADANDTIAQVRIPNIKLYFLNNTISQSFLSEFIQTGNSIGLSIAGDSDSTPFASLEGALAGLRLTTSLSGKCTYSKRNILANSNIIRAKPAHVYHSYPRLNHSRLPCDKSRVGGLRRV